MAAALLFTLLLLVAVSINAQMGGFPGFGGGGGGGGGEQHEGMMMSNNMGGGGGMGGGGMGGGGMGGGGGMVGGGGDHQEQGGDKWGGGKCPGEHFGFHDEPAFFEDLTLGQLRQYFHLKFNNTLTKGQIANQTAAFIATLSSQAQSDYAAWQQNVTAIKAAFAANLTAATSSLSAAAQSLISQIQTVVANPDLTYLQTCEQIVALTLAVNDSVLQELHLPHSSHNEMGMGMNGGGGASGVTPTPLPVANVSAMVCEHAGPFGGDEGWQHHQFGQGGGGFNRNSMGGGGGMENHSFGAASFMAGQGGDHEHEHQKKRR